MAASVDAKLLKQTKFPPEFSRKVDMTKVNIEVMKKWIAGKISEILGSEDDVVIELCFNLLEGSRFPDIKSLQIQLTGFLDKDTPKFCKELWSLCLSAQENPQGVPKELLEAKKLELIREKIEAEKAAEEARRQKEQERIREREIEEIRQRERNEVYRGRRGGGRSGRDFDRRAFRGSRSPPRRRSRDRFRDRPFRRESDSYVPAGPRRTRQRSKSATRSPSRSPASPRSPPHRARRGNRDTARPRRRRSVSSSVSPDRHDRRRPGRRTPNNGDHRDRSNSRSDYSRSRSPRRDRRRRRSVSSRKLSPSPARRDRRTRRAFPKSMSRSRSPARSRSGSRTREDMGSRRRRSPPQDSKTNRREGIAGVGKERFDRDGRRLSTRRGPSDRHKDQNRSLSRNRSRGLGRPRTMSASPRRARCRSRSRSRSHSRDRSNSPQKDKKRRRSIERYAPAARRQRDASPVSPSNEKRQKIIDSDNDTTKQQPPPARSWDSADMEMKDANESIPSKPKVLRLSSTELRERLLREKLVAMRRTATSSEKVGGR